MRKRKSMGKLLSVLLCLAMTLGVLSIMALAAEPIGDHTLWGRAKGAATKDISFFVRKTDNNGNSLEGALFELTPRQQSNDGGSSAYSDENGIAAFDVSIAPGIYTLAEAEAPFGYITAANRYTVEVYETPDAEGNVLSINPIIPNFQVNIIPTPYKNGATIATFVNEPMKTVEISLPIEKTVVQNGSIAPGEESFTFELLKDDGEDLDGTPVYQLIGTADITTNGAGTADHTLKFAIPEELNSMDGFGQNHIYLRERKGSADGWKYSDVLYQVNCMNPNEGVYVYTFDGEDPTAGVGLKKAVFTNTFSSMSCELPFTKTVKLGGSAAPGRETFELEIFKVGNSNLTNYSNLYTAAVNTNGASDYEGTLVISGPADSVKELVRNGFYVREKNAGTANWTYDDAVWHIMPQNGQIVGQIVVPPLVNIPSGNTSPEETEPEFSFDIRATTRTMSDNGVYYVDSEMPAAKMTFTNTYDGSTGAVITANLTDLQGRDLAGASFVLEDSRGREAYRAVSDTDGLVCFTNVSSGTYTLLERSAPTGYVVSGETYELTVSGSRVTMNGDTYSPVTFVNRKAAELNRTDHFAFLVGYTDGTFGPERDMTRAEVTTMFARLLTEKIEADKTYPNTFVDVPKGHWAANYIGYMQQFGIIMGYSDGSFHPDAPVTRAEFAAIASRFEKLTEGSKSFTDVPDTFWAARYINFAATRGWVTGYSDGTFKPNEPITRAEVAAVTCRLLERSADQSYIRTHLKELRTFSDMAERHWAYLYVMEAANGHDYIKSGGSESWSRTYR